MATIEWSGTDLDSLLEPYHSGTKAATTHIQYNGQDLCDRYQAVAAGNGTAYGATKLEANGVDIGSLFVKKGTWVSGLTVTVSPASAGSNTSGTLSVSSPTTGTVTASASGGTGTGYTYSWAITSTDGVATSYLATAPSSATTAFRCTIQVTPGTQETTNYTATVTATDSGGNKGTQTVSVGQTYYDTSTSCPTAFSILSNGQQASTFRIGDKTRVTNPYVMTPGNTVDGEILIAEARESECVHVLLANGAWFECSVSAPIPTREAGHVRADSLRPDDPSIVYTIPCATRNQLRSDSIPFAWVEVISVAPLGKMPVMLMYVNDRDFWISGDGEYFVLHHNAKVIN